MLEGSEWKITFHAQIAHFSIPPEVIVAERV